jgi:acetylornithine deacetylase/succinyl-diaminopimelate desuccinylase-like protein
MPIDGDYLLATLEQSIRINSVIPHEAAYAAFLADEIRALGLEPEWHEVAPGRPNVYVTAALGPVDKTILLTGHTDTVDVAANWQTDPFEPVRKDGRIYGLGAYDMKSGVVCALAALKALVEETALHPHLGRVAFAATVDEEGYGLGAKAMLDTPYAQADAILLTEPFGGDGRGAVPLGLTGKVLYRLFIEGQMAHGFHPERGRNAVEDAGKIIAALSRLNLRAHPVHGRGNYSTLKIEGGYKEYAIVVPERCEVIITRLTVPGESRATAVEDMQALLASLDLTCDVRVETPPPFYEPYEIALDADVARSFAHAYRREFAAAPPWAFMKGITTVTFGPAGDGAHECNEYVTVDSLVPVARVLRDTCVEFMRNPA